MIRKLSRLVVGLGIVSLMGGGMVYAQSHTEAAGSASARASEGGTIKGVCTFKGEVPAPEELNIDKDVEVCGKRDKTSHALIVSDDKKIANVVVSIRKFKAEDGWQSKQPIEFDQQSCTFSPHVLLVPEGTPVEFKNSDPLLHNIHTYSVKNAGVNEGIPAGKSMDKTFKSAENVKVTCDVHKWMEAWIIVMDHPYYALSSKDGTFSLDNVPPGKYELMAWHEKLGRSKNRPKVEVAEGGTVEVSFEFEGR